MSLFITRPAPDAQSTVSQLATAGIDAVAVPLMEIHLHPAPLAQIPEEAILAFTSANGARAWAAAGGPKRQVFAVGDATARVAAELGLSVEGVASGDVQALITLLEAEIAGRPIIHIRGKHAIGELTSALEKKGHASSALELYEARPVTELPGSLTNALAEGGHGIGLFSPRSMGLFLSLTEKARLLSKLTKMTAFCLSPAVAEIGANKGFQSIHVAERPDLVAFVDTARLRHT